jgi:hypothetical protein
VAGRLPHRKRGVIELSFDELEKSLEKTEAISNYRRVKEERDDFEAKLGEERRSHAEESQRMQKEIEELQALKVRFSEAEYGLKEFEALVERESAEWRKKELNKALNERWGNESPNLISTELNRQLSDYPKNISQHLRQLIETKVNEKVNATLKDRRNWPFWFCNVYNSEVREGAQSQINAEFKRRVDEATKTGLLQLKNIEWPTYLRSVAITFFQKPLQQQLINLCIPLTLTCNKCRLSFNFQPNPTDMAEMIRTGVIYVQCINPQCRDLIIPHKMPLYLADIIAIILNLSP